MHLFGYNFTAHRIDFYPFYDYSDFLRFIGYAIRNHCGLTSTVYLFEDKRTIYLKNASYLFISFYQFFAQMFNKLEHSRVVTNMLCNKFIIQFVL